MNIFSRKYRKHTGRQFSTKKTAHIHGGLTIGLKVPRKILIKDLIAGMVMSIITEPGSIDYGIPYIINGLGGRWQSLPTIHHFGLSLEGSQVGYSRDYGAQLVTVDEICINVSFYNRAGELIDSYTLKKQMIIITLNGAQDFKRDIGSRKNS